MEDLKWHNFPFDEDKISKDELLGMLRVNKHPILKRIKNQLIIENIAWTCFLAIYDDFFDGHLRISFCNGILILAVGMLLIHNLLGYKVTNNPINGKNILDSLKAYLKNMPTYPLRRGFLPW